jgi:hypothetical protein
MIAFASGLIGAKALYLLFGWLISAAVASYVSDRKGYGERWGHHRLEDDGRPCERSPFWRRASSLATTLASWPGPTTVRLDGPDPERSRCTLAGAARRRSRGCA